LCRLGWLCWLRRLWVIWPDNRVDYGKLITAVLGAVHFRSSGARNAVLIASLRPCACGAGRTAGAACCTIVAGLARLAIGSSRVDTKVTSRAGNAVASIASLKGTRWALDATSAVGSWVATTDTVLAVRGTDLVGPSAGWAELAAIGTMIGVGSLGALHAHTVVDMGAWRTRIALVSISNRTRWAKVTAGLARVLLKLASWAVSTFGGASSCTDLTGIARLAVSLTLLSGDEASSAVVASQRTRVGLKLTSRTGDTLGLSDKLLVASCAARFTRTRARMILECSSRAGRARGCAS